MPTEAESEKAARGTDGRVYPWGDGLPTHELCNFDKLVGDTTPVDAYRQGASPYDVMDMAGNVWEWTSSLKLPYPYNPNDGREDLSGDAPRILRGGAWDSDDSDVRCANRLNINSPNGRNDRIGFRVVSFRS